MNSKKHSDQNLIYIVVSSYVIILFLIQVLASGFSLFQIKLSPWVARSILIAAIGISLGYFSISKGFSKFALSVRKLKGYQFLGLGFILIVFFIFILLWILAIKTPDFSFDGNMYHIPKISMWDIKGYIHWVETKYLDTLINGYPGGAETATYVLVKAFDNSMINVGNLLFIPLGMIGITALARSLGASRLLSICAGASFVLVPVNFYQSMTNYVDTAFACCVIGLLSVLIYLISAQIVDWWGNIIFGAVMGLTLSIKSNGIAICLIATVALVISWVIKMIQYSRTTKEEPKRKQVQVMLLRGIASLFVILAFAILGGGYWYIRNLVMTGTPLYPVGLTIFGQTIFPGISISAAIDAPTNTPILLQHTPRLVRFIYTWFQGFTTWPKSIIGYDNRLGGLGFFWILICVPAITASILSISKFTKKTRRNFIFIFCVVVLAFFITPLNWWARYTIWIYALGLPCAALIISGIVYRKNTKKSLRILAIIWIILGSSLLLYETIYNTKTILAQSSPGSLNIKNVLKEETWTWQTSYLFPDMQGTVLEKILMEPSQVIIGPRGEMDWWRYVGYIGQLSQPIGDRQLFFIAEDPSEGELTALSNARYIIWDDSVTLPQLLESRAESIFYVKDFIVLSLPNRR